jgi:hypothetical protein
MSFFTRLASCTSQTDRHSRCIDTWSIAASNPVEFKDFAFDRTSGRTRANKVSGTPSFRCGLASAQINHTMQASWHFAPALALRIFLPQIRQPNIGTVSFN